MLCRLFFTVNILSSSLKDSGNSSQSEISHSRSVLFVVKMLIDLHHLSLRISQGKSRILSRDCALMIHYGKHEFLICMYMFVRMLIFINKTMFFVILSLS